MAGSRRARRLMRTNRHKGVVLEKGTYTNYHIQTDYIYVETPDKKLVHAVSYGSDVYISKYIKVGDKVQLIKAILPYGFAWIKENEPCGFVLESGVDWDFRPRATDPSSENTSEVEEGEYGYTVKRHVSKLR